MNYALNLSDVCTMIAKGVTISTYSFNERESAVHEDVPDKMLLFLFGDRFKAIFTL